MPSFDWGFSPSPDMSEYLRHQSYYDAIYAVPYYTAALLFTAVGCFLAPRLTRGVQSLRRRALATGTITLLLVGAGALVSDIGSLTRIWEGPLFLLTAWDLGQITALFRVLMPPSFLAGVIVLLKWQIATWDAESRRE
jgi:hypothetical protein